MMPRRPMMPSDVPRSTIRLAVMGVGFSSAVTQLVLLREFLASVQGNELILGILLGNWLLLTGVGTGLGRWLPGAARPNRAWRLLACLQTGLALVPLVQVLAVRSGHHVFFLRGATLGAHEAALESLLLLAPYCIASGLVLTLASRLADPADEPRGLGDVYLSDGVGSVIGGAAFTFALVHWFDHLAVLVTPALVNLALAARVLGHTADRRAALAPVGLGLGLLSLFLVTNPDASSAAWQCAPDRLVFRANSPYGRLVVTESAGQLTFLENGLPVLSSEETERAEETAHFALAQRPQAQSVLLISGGLSGSAREVLKYGVTNLTCVELDPAILDAGRRLLPERLADPRIQVVNTDGRHFVQRTPARYDVVIVDMPAPATAQVNRYYTVEFFAAVKRILAPEGVLAFGLGHYENYVSPELARLLASAAYTLRQHFDRTLLLPAGKVWFLASDGPLTGDIAARIEQAGVATHWMRRPYLEAMLTPDRRAAVESAVGQPARLNTDAQPVLYFYHLRHWLSQFDFAFGLTIVGLGGGLSVYLARLRAPCWAVLGSGLAASALELVLLLSVQVLCGSLYHQLGLVITVFMAGLALGAWVGRRETQWRSRRHLARVALGLAAYAALLPGALGGIGWSASGAAPTFMVQTGIALLTAGLAVLVGLEFPLASRVAASGDAAVAARLYTADFIGACVGALVAGAWLIPVLGVATVCGVVAGLNALVGLALLRRS